MESHKNHLRISAAIFLALLFSLASPIDLTVQRRDDALASVAAQATIFVAQGIEPQAPRSAEVSKKNPPKLEEPLVLPQQLVPAPVVQSTCQNLQ